MHNLTRADRGTGTAVGIAEQDTIALDHYDSTTGFHLLDAGPLSCEAPAPGSETRPDLPWVAGCTGDRPWGAAA